MQITLNGIVVKEQTVGDDRLVHLLTDDLGIVSAFARGAKKPRSQFASTTEFLCYGRLVLFSYRDNYTINSADCENSFFKLRHDLDKLSLAYYISDLACELAPREEPAKEYLSLVLNTLHMLCNTDKSLKQIKALFELRIMSLAGFMPDLTACESCGLFEGEMMFSIQKGALICKECNQTMQQPADMMPPATLAAMRHIIYSEPKKLFSFNITDNALEILAATCEQYTLCHLDKTFKTLNFYHSLTNI